MKLVILVSSVQVEVDSEILMVLFVNQYDGNRARYATVILDSPCEEAWGPRAVCASFEQFQEELPVSRLLFLWKISASRSDLCLRQR
jgi:hypothetical protein